MHRLFAGFMGLFFGATSFFHGHITPTPSITISGTPTPSVAVGSEERLENGGRPFFGTVTAVNGSTLTVQLQMPMGMMRPDVPSITPFPHRTLTVLLTNQTKYSSGSASNITVNTTILGRGKMNTDGTLTAIQIIINPTFPTGMPGRGMHFGKVLLHHPSEVENDNDR